MTFPTEEELPTQPGRNLAVAAERRRAIVERLLACWETLPHLRLAQLIVNSVASEADGLTPPDEGLDVRDRLTLDMMWKLEDSELALAIERWVNNIPRP